MMIHENQDQPIEITQREEYPIDVRRQSQQSHEPPIVSNAIPITS